MDITEQVTKWVENKIEKVLSKHLKENIVDENSTFDVCAYANYLLEKYFDEDDVRSLQEILIINSYDDFLYFESENSTAEQSIQDFLESESNECQTFSVDEMIKNLESDSEEIRKKSLKLLDSCAEVLINQLSWNKIKEVLQKILNKEGDRQILALVLEVFQKPLKCSKKPQIISKGFITIAEILIHQIHLFNVERRDSTCKMFDVNNLQCEKSQRTGKFITSKRFATSEILIKLMWLLMDCQQQMPITWVRFNEARFREIVFSFIHLLSCTNTCEKKLSGLELLSVLNPRASWCRYWCHTAVGRSLLCSALRKYKNFFIQIIEIILDYMKTKKSKRLPPIRGSITSNRQSHKCEDDIKFIKTNNDENKNEKKNHATITKCSRAAPLNNGGNNFSNVIIKKMNSEWIVENIPKKVVTEAVFLHSVSFVSYLIQYRSGRALFPVQIATRKRLLSVQDLSLSVIEFLENIDYNECNSTGITYTSVYAEKISEILDILKRVKAHINSSRMSTERQQFYYL